MISNFLSKYTQPSIFSLRAIVMQILLEKFLLNFFSKSFIFSRSPAIIDHYRASLSISQISVKASKSFLCKTHSLKKSEFQSLKIFNVRYKFFNKCLSDTKLNPTPVVLNLFLVGGTLSISKKLAAH